jgi:hypothetical protein
MAPVATAIGGGAQTERRAARNFAPGARRLRLLPSPGPAMSGTTRSRVRGQGLAR